MARIAADEQTQRWWRLTDPCHSAVGAECEWWAPAEELFHLD